ncbi:FecR family protein [Agarilytica rhodophyticola]|uniref:FecR family protein n=1 Tax=Agarilytica rhodophyticola TaxID=1737490 RepID=UPI000B3444C4|nr:FecR domain-containing protein [Agarilytica rhodophyticola]
MLKDAETTDKNRIDTEACQWFALIYGGNVSDKDLKAFDAWKLADLRHQQACLDLDEIWYEISELQYIPTQDLAEDKALSRNEKSSGNFRWPFIFQFWQANLRTQLWAGIGTTILCLTLITVGVFYDNKAPLHYQTEVGQIQEVILVDGSIVTLSGASSIEVIYTERMRKLQLQRGQAFFDVTSSPSRPFVVSAGGIDTRVLGTKFDIRLGHRNIRVSVVEGDVNVNISDTDSTSGKHLSGGDQITIVSEEKELRLSKKTKVDTRLLSDWLAGRLSYRDAYLRDVIEDANRFFNGQIFLNEEALGDMKITASFNAAQIGQMLESLPLLLPVKVYKERADRIIIASEL